MRINWFGTMYYGENKEFRRSVWIAFKCLFDKIKWRIIGEGYFVFEKTWYHFYRWNKKNTAKEYIKKLEGNGLKPYWRKGNLWI